MEWEFKWAVVRMRKQFSTVIYLNVPLAAILKSTAVLPHIQHLYKYFNNSKLGGREAFKPSLHSLFKELKSNVDFNQGKSLLIFSILFHKRFTFRS